MGLHTGEAEERDDDYFGQTLNRVSRLQSLAYGGQTLLSQAVYELVRDRLPDRVSLRSLGPHRLRYLTGRKRFFRSFTLSYPLTFRPSDRWTISPIIFRYNLPVSSEGNEKCRRSSVCLHRVAG